MQFNYGFGFSDKLYSVVISKKFNKGALRATQDIIKGVALLQLCQYLQGSKYNNLA